MEMQPLLLSLPLVLLLFLRTTPSSVTAQESPNPLLSIELFSTPRVGLNSNIGQAINASSPSVGTLVEGTFRHDFCELSKQRANVGTDKMLDGVSLNVLLDGDGYANFDVRKSQAAANSAIS